MIVFDEVTKSYPVGSKRLVVLSKLNFSFQEGINLGVLGHNGAGKSTLFRLLSGSEQPDYGTVTRKATVSWPLGFAGGFHGSLTGRENIRFVARIYGRNARDTFNFVDEFSELGRYIDMPVKSYSSGMRARLAFGLSMAIDFEFYLIDEVIAVGDSNFKKKCRGVLDERRKNSTIILISHSNSLLKDFCQSGAVLNNGEFSFYEDINDAIEAHETNQILAASLR
ncbi:ABC transporter ATP-binding protein [Brucella pituitosa]|uniref:ABC transporter ATP-binding protein n=1 Tax=Brucella pituitosa TaxID=571256 RepID=UPI002004E3AC|nr:ABC transporter ATP-binding protein [Brucella pituitosa]MCK4207060.1 ABC transporter ATP-binding protein [Brucella pituitosa]